MHCNEPLKDIEFKKNILLATITRDRKIEFPGGNSYFQPGDRVIVVSNGSMPNIQLNDIFEEDKEERMNYKIMMRVCAWILVIEIGCMTPALGVAIYTGDQMAVIGFIGAMATAGAMSLLMYAGSVRRRMNFYAKEGMLVTAFAWILLSIVGALPFYLSGRIPGFVDALFEIISGFTTTGASVVSDVEGLGKGLLFWRSYSHWIGGMGVLVFFLAIIPSAHKGEGYSLHLLRAESGALLVNKMVPRMRDTATALYRIYVVLTVINIVLLLLSGMKPFDSFCIAFGTAGTGGFAVLNSGCAEYTPMAQWITTVFMLLFGINFSVYYMMAHKRFKEAIKGEELRVYLFIVFASIAGIAANLMRSGSTHPLGKNVRDAAFQVASIITTTGFSTADFNLWPDFSQAILICLMFVGAAPAVPAAASSFSNFDFIQIRQTKPPQRIPSGGNSDRAD